MAARTQESYLGAVRELAMFYVDRPMNRKFLSFTVRRNGARLKLAGTLHRPPRHPPCGPAVGGSTGWHARRSDL